MAATSRFESVLIARWALIMGVRGAKGEADTSFSGEDAHRSDKSRATYRSPTESATHGLEFVLVGNVAAQLVGTAAGQAALRSTGRANPGLVRGIRTGVLSIGILMAVSQLGINTTLVNLMAAGVVFGLSASTALLIGLGGRDVASHVAAGRYLRRVVHPGDVLTVSGVSGTVVAVHPATVELALEGGGRAHVPHGHLLADVVRMDAPPSTKDQEDG